MNGNPSAKLDDRINQSPGGVERRAVERAALRLAGRYMLPDRREFSCHTINISPDGALVQGPETSEPGSRVVLHIEHIGSLESVVAWSQQNRFAVRFVAPPRKTEKVAQKIEFLLRDQAPPDRRNHERLLQNYDRVTVERADGALSVARIEDISARGAALISSVQFRVGETVMVDGRKAVVKHCFDNGIGIAFDVR